MCTHSSQRNTMKRKLLFALVLTVLLTDVAFAGGVAPHWQAGFARRVVTPKTPVWLAGYGMKRAPDSTIHDIWIKVMALKDRNGNRLVLVTTDHQGMSKTIYENLYKTIHTEFGLGRSEFMLTFSHNHCGPRLTDDLEDYYPEDPEQTRLVNEYSDWMQTEIVSAVREALANFQQVRIFAGEGECAFAVNRRDNVEAEVPQAIAEGKPLKGVVDHYVPVLAVKSTTGNLLAVLFGYACHPTTLRINSWNGDYPGFAQINIEKRFPTANAMFFNACGGDQNPLPRRTVELCMRYGQMLSDAVEEVLKNRMTELSSKLQTAYEHVNLDYDEVATQDNLASFLKKENTEIEVRWAKKMQDKLSNGAVFSTSYSYPVQAVRLDKLLIIGMAGETVVDYSLKFKKKYPGLTWVSGYTNEMAAYIPSRRVWEEGGYEGGPHINEYGRPAWRWAGTVEERITSTVAAVVTKVRKKHYQKKNK